MGLVGARLCLVRTTQGMYLLGGVGKKQDLTLYLDPLPWVTLDRDALSITTLVERSALEL